MKEKIVLITGASSGIGRATYKMCVEKGWTVYGTSRKMKANEVKPVDGGSMIRLDVTDDESVKQAISLMMAREGGLDALVNNAGFGIAGAVEDTSIPEDMEQFNTNFFGVLRMTRAALPLLRQNKGHIVNVSSVAGVLAIPFQGMYSASKAALEIISETLRIELADEKIPVCLVLPGDTKTSFTENRQITCVSETSDNYQRMKTSVGKMEKDEQNGVDPRNVAKVICRMIEKKNPPVRRAVGFSYQFILFLKRLLPDRLVLWALKKLYACKK